MLKTLRGRRWTGWSKRKPSVLRPFPSLRVEELEARTTPAVTFTWTGGGTNQNWSNAANWVSSDPVNFPNPTGNPANFESLTFPNGPTVRTTSNDIQFSGVNGTFFTVTVSGSNYALAGKAITLGTTAATGNINVGANISGSHIDFNMTLAGAALSKQFFTVSDNSSFTLNGQILGSTGSIFTKDGIGTLILTANNSNFTGDIQIIDGGGTLQITNANALGNLSGSTTVGTGATLAVNGVTGNISESLVINGPGVSNLGALRSVGGTANTWAGSILVDTNATFGADANTSINITGPIGDSGAGRDIVKEGPGEVRFSAANTYHGRTTIEDGVLTIANALALGAARDTSIVVPPASSQAALDASFAATGTYVNDPAGPRAGRLQITGGITVLNERLELHNAGGSGPGVGSFYNAGGNNNWAGPVVLDNTNISEGSTVTIGVAVNTNLIVSGVVTGTRPLVKVDTGRLIFDNNNSYGPLPALPQIPGTIVAQGFMTMRDSGALGVNAVQVADGATLEMEVEIATPTINRFGYNQNAGTQFGRDLWNDSFYGADPNRLRLANQLTINGRGFQETGALRSKSGINTVSNSVTLDASGSDASIGVDLDQRPGHPTPTSAYWTSDYSLTVTGLISGGGTTSFLKRGAGQLILPRANSYSGVTQIEEGWVTIQNEQALGPVLWVDSNGNGLKDAGEREIHDTITPRIYVLTGAALHLKAPNAGTSLSFNRNLTITGSGPSLPYSLLNSKGALVNIGGDNLWTGDVQILGTTGIGVEQVDPSLPVSQLTITGSMKDAINSQTFRSDSSGVEGAIWIDTGTTSGTVNATLTISQPPSPPISNFRIYDPPRYRTGSTQLFNYPGGYGSPPPTVVANQAYAGDSSILEYVVNEPSGSGGWSLTVTSPTIAGNLVKYGSQRLRLEGDATYSGSTQVLEGILRDENDTAVGRASSGTLTTQQTYTQTQTSVSTGAVIELQHGLASANGGIASGLVIYDEKLVLNGSGYQVHVAGDPLDAQFQLSFDTGIHTFTTAAVPITAATTALDLQNAINADPLLAGEGLTATVTKTNNVFSIVFGTALSNDLVSLTASAIGSAEVRIVNGQASVNNLSDDNTWRGPVSLNAGSRIRTGDNSRFVILGSIDDTSAPGTGAHLVKRGNGELTLGGANTYRGTTLASAGVLTLLSSQALGFGDSTAATGTIIAQGAQLQLSGSLTINNEALTISGSGTGAGTATPSAIPVRWVQTGPGPSNQGQTPGSTPVSGRVTGVTVDPSDPNVIYIATEGGGAWKTKDGGKTWLPLFDYAANAVPMSGGSITIDPLDRRTLYFGTGEGNNSADSFGGTGVWMSVDAGVTWTRMDAATGMANPLAGLSVNKMVVDQTLLVTAGGVYPVGVSRFVYVATSDITSNGFNVAAPGIWRFDKQNATWTNLTATTSPTRATMKGQGAWTNFPVNSPGPNDDYRVTFPQSNVSWDDLAIAYFVPSPGNQPSRGVIYASAMEKAEVWFPGGLTDRVNNGGYMTGVFRSENPNSSAPDWLIGDSGETTTAPPKADNRSGSEFPFGPFDPTSNLPWRSDTANGAAQAPRNGHVTLAVSGGGSWTGVTVWAGVARPTDITTQTATDGRLLEIRLSQNGGLTWNAVALPAGVSDVLGSSGQGQGPYAAVMFAPDTNTVYIGGSSSTSIWMGTVGGTWTSISMDAASNGPFAFNRAMAADSSGRLLLGGDGGLYRYDPVAARWNDLNGTLSASLVTSVAGSAADFNNIAAGTGLTGVSIFSGDTNWIRTDDGSGGTIVRDPNNPTTLYHVQYYPAEPNRSYPYATVRKSTNNGATWTTVYTTNTTLNPDQTRDIFYRGNPDFNHSAFPLAIDTINPQRLLTTDGFNKLFETLNGFSSTPSNITGNYSGGFIRNIALGMYQGLWVDDPGFPNAPNSDTDRGANAYDPKTIYIADDNSPYVTKDGGFTWQQRSLNVKDDVYSLTFGAGVLKYKDFPQITFSGVPAGVYVTARTTQNGVGSTPNFAAQLDERQSIEVIYPSGTTGSFQATFTYAGSGAPYNLAALSFTITINVGDTAATIQSKIATALGTPTGDEFQALAVSNVSTTSTPTFTLTVGAVTTGAITWVPGNPATTIANISAAFAATTPPITGITPVASGTTIYLRYTGSPNTDVVNASAVGTNMEMYVREAQKGGAGSISVSGGNNNGTSLRITSLTVDPSNHDHVIATVSYANHANGPTVFETTSAGSPTASAPNGWTNITGSGLPTLVLDSVAPATVTQTVWTSEYDARSGRIYVGTDIGVYASDNDGATWYRFGDGLPNVAVRDIELNVSANILTIGTYGRGTYQLFLSSAAQNTGAVRAVAGNSTWSGPVTLAGATTLWVDGTQVIQNGLAAASLNILGTVSDGPGDFDLVKEGQGTLILSGANTYGGVTYVNHGVLQVNNPLALGDFDAASNTIVAAGSALELATDLYREPVTVFGDGYSFSGHNTGALRNVSGVNTYTGPLTMATPTTIGVNSNTQLTIGAKDGDSTYVNGNGSITDGANNFTLAKELTGTLVLGNANSYEGQTNVIQGALRVAHADALGVGPGTGDTLVYNGAQLQISRNNATLAPTIVVNESLRLSGTGINATGAIQNVRGDSIPGGTNDNEWAGSITLVRQNNFSPTSVATREVAFGSSDGTLRINTSFTEEDASYTVDKVGVGRVTFMKANTYTGQTNVYAGYLRIMNDLSLGNTDTVGTIVNTGASLELDGTFASLAPVERLTLNGEGVNNAGALNNVVNDNAYNGPITLGANNQSTVLGGSIGAVIGTTLTVNGLLQDPAQNGTPGSVNPLPGRFRKAGAGTVVLPDAKTYAGATLVSDGILRVQDAQSLGTPRNEVQFVQLIASTGTFALSFKGVSTAPIAFNASAAAVQAALNAISPLSSIGATVSVALTNAPGINTYTITFNGGPLQNSEQPQILPIYVEPSTFTRTVGTATVREVQSFRVTSSDPNSNWALTYGAARTDAIALNATAATVEAAIEAVTGEDVTVIRSGGVNDFTYTVTFTAFGPKTAFASLVQQGTTLVAGTNRDGQRDTTVASGATLQIDGALAYTFPASGERIILNGQGFSSGGNKLGALNIASGSGVVTFNVPILLASDASIGVTGPSDQLVINSVIADTGGSGRSLDFYGQGKTTLNGNGTGSYSGTSYTSYYSGATHVNSGTLELNVTGQPAILGALTVGDAVLQSVSPPPPAIFNVGATVLELLDNQIADTSTVRVNSDGKFDLGSKSDTVFDFTMVGGVALTGDGGKLTTGKIDMSAGALIAVGNNASLTAGSVAIPGSTTMANSDITVGTNSTVTVNGSLGMNVSHITFASPGPGTLAVTGNISLTNGSKIGFDTPPGGPLTISGLDLFLDASSIDLADSGKMTFRNVTLQNTSHIDFDNAGVFKATGAVSVSGLSDITFDNDGRFDITGNLVLNNGKVAMGPATATNTIPPLTPATTLATLTTGQIDMTGGTSEINIGDGGYLTANGKVTSNDGDILFGTAGTFRAVGNLTMTGNASVQFGSGGLFDNQSFDTSLTNSKFTMADGGTAKTYNLTLALASKLDFTNNGNLQAPGTVNMTGASELTFDNSGAAATGDIIIVGGKIEFLNDGKLNSGKVVDTNAPITFQDNGLMDANGPVTVNIGGSIGFGTLVPATHTVTGGINGKFTAAGALGLDASNFFMGTGGQAATSGLTLSNASFVTFADAGKFDDNGPLNMNGLSEIYFGSDGILNAGDLNQAGGLIKFQGANGTLDPANVFMTGGARVSFADSTGTNRARFLPNNLTVNNSFIDFGSNGTLSASGNVSFAKTALTMAANADVDVLGLSGIVTTGATTITLGDDSTLDTTTMNVTGPSAVLAFGQRNVVTSSGDVTLSSAAGTFQSGSAGKNSALNVTGTLNLIGSTLDFSQYGLVNVTGAGNINLSSASRISFTDPGKLHADGDVVLTGVSKLAYTTNGILEAKNLSITTGSITMGDGSSATGSGAANINSATVTLGNNSTFDFKGGTSVVSVGSGTPALTLGASSKLGVSPNTGKLVVTTGNVTIGTGSTAYTGDVVVTGSSKMTIGTGAGPTVFNAGKVDTTTGTWTFGNSAKLLASGDVTLTNSGMTFGTVGVLQSDGDLRLNNTPLTFGATATVDVDNAFITNKSKITFGNSSTLKAHGPLNDNAGGISLDNAQVKFSNGGNLIGGLAKLVNSSIAGGNNIQVNIDALDMDPSTLTLGDGSGGIIDGDVVITDGAVTMGDGVNIEVTGSFTSTNAAISFGNSGSLDVAGTASVDHGGVTLGSSFRFTAGDTTLTDTNFSQGDLGTFAVGDLGVQDSLVNLGTNFLQASSKDLGLASSTLLLGSGTNFVIAGDLSADSTNTLAQIIGDGSIDIGDTTHGLDVGNGDGLDTVDFAIFTEINSAAPARLVKTGAGRVALVAPSGTSAAVTINAGDVQVSTSVGDVQLAGGTLSGLGEVGTLSGTSGAAVGIVAPGNNWDTVKAGVLTSNAATWGPGTTFNVDLSHGATVTPTAGVDYDALDVNGDISLGGAVLTANYGPGIQLNDSFTIINATGNVTGKFQQFNNQDLLFVAGQKFTIEYTQHTVVLHKVLATATVTMTSTPNPSTYRQPVVLTATVVPELGSSLFSGTINVTFFDDGGAMATVPVNLVAGQYIAIYTTISTDLEVGNNVLTARFLGDASNFAPSDTPAPDVVQVVQAPFTDVLTAGPLYLSPNNATSTGVNDTYSISTTARNERGSITWTIDIRNPSSTIIRTLSGSGNPGAGTTIPIATTWDGKNNGGVYVNLDGPYTATLTVTDSFGNSYSPAASVFTVDNTTPTASLPAPSASAIAPASSGVLPTTTTFTGTVGDTNLSGWVLSIKNGTTLLRSWSGTGSAVNVTWDGKYDPLDATDPASPTSQAPDAAYTVTLTANDLAGNTITTSSQTVVLLANGPGITLSTGPNSVYGSTYTLTATVSLPPGTPNSLVSLLAGDTIEFYRGGSLLGTGALAFNAGANAYQATYLVQTPSLSVGTYSTFSAVYPASTDFPRGQSANASHTITPAPLNIVIQNKNRTYGAANPTLTFTANSPVNGDTVAQAVVGSPATTAGLTTGVGSYSISQGTIAATSNYFINSITNGTLTITPAPIRVQIDNKSRPVNTPNPAFTYTVLDLLNGDPQSSVTGLTMSTVATITSPVGSYPITPANVPTVNPNYTVSQILNGTLDITPVLTEFSMGMGPSLSPTDPSRVNVYSPTGTLIRSFTPFGAFSGGIRTAVGDFNGDHIQDIAVATGPGAVAQVSIFSGANGLPLFTTLPFDNFTGGVFVAAGDIDADGIAELVITPDQGGGPRVLAFHGGDFKPFISFFGIDDPNFRGGARAGVGDMNGDGFAEIAVSAGFQGGPRISVWDGKSLSSAQFKHVMPDFFAYDKSLRNGAYVAIGDVNGDGKGDLITGAGPGGAPHVKIFSGESLLNPAIGPGNTVPFASFFAGNPANRGGIRVASKVFDNDLFVDVVTGAGEGGGDHATTYLGKDLKDGIYRAELDIDFPGVNNNGVFVG